MAGLFQFGFLYELDVSSFPGEEALITKEGILGDEKVEDVVDVVDQ